MSRLSLFVILMFLFVCVDLAASNVHYYIVPSLNVSCPQEPCLTLSQFATNISRYCGNNNNVSLFFQPGNHSLAFELSLATANIFSMVANVRDDEAAFVRCINRSGRFRIRDSIFVLIKGLHFIGCGGNEIIQVKRFILEDAIFLGESLGWLGSSLVLQRVANASVVRCSFLLNSNTAYYGYGGAMYVTESSFSIIGSNFVDNSASSQGGVVYTNTSSFSITTSNFAGNRAPNGGVIYTSASLFSISSSNFTNNSASSGRVVYAYQTSFIIYGGGVMFVEANSQFSVSLNNFAYNNASNVGGVMYISQSSFNITNNTIKNSIADSGGVLYTSESLFNITNNTIENCVAVYSGGVMYTLQSSFYIIASTFTKNYAYYGGGVILTHGSQFSITTSSFVENNASSGSGGVMHTLQSSFYIIASTFTKNHAYYGGGVILTHGSRFSITTSSFVENNASSGSGGVMYTWQSSFNITNSNFVENSATLYGGALYGENQSTFSVTASSFTNNRASYGGVMDVVASSFAITTADFTDNRATYSGGVMYIQESFSCNITSSKSTENYASYGGVVFLHNSSLNVMASVFDNNRASLNFVDGGKYIDDFGTNQITCDGKVLVTLIENKIYECGILSGVIASAESLFTVANSSFTNNTAVLGVINALNSAFIITNSIYANNSANVGGVITTFYSSFTISNNSFSNNHANFGGVASTFESSFSIDRSNFTNNRASYDGGVIYTVSTFLDNKVTIADSTFGNNTAAYSGIMFIIGTTVDVVNGKFYQNVGSFYAFSSSVTFRGVTTFENCKEPSSKSRNNVLHQEGGAITSYLSMVTFTGTNIILNNKANDGSAILAIDSGIIMQGETTIANNNIMAANGSGGGIHLIQSNIAILGICNFTQNHATRGGGIHASSSSIVVYQQGVLRFTNNSAKFGGGVYLNVSSRLITFSKFPGIWREECENGLVQFIDNHANYGGAVYVEDNSSMSCFSSIECPIQSMAINNLLSNATNVSMNRSMVFSGNSATNGSNIFGGLFDRCIPSPFAMVNIHNTPVQYSGISYLQAISNVTLDSIASLPVRVCFCNSTGQPNCSYEMPTIKVKKGEAFTVSVVAVDQVNQSMDAVIYSVIYSPHGGLSEGQQLQSVRKNCTQLTFNVFSPDDSETIELFAHGPCEHTVISKKFMVIQFLNCTCSIGFEPSTSTDNRCECICNSTLSPYITKCNYTTNSILRVNTNSWITYMNYTDPPGFIIYPDCPLDYCFPPCENVSMNLNLPSGSDAQCAHSRSGILCGACLPNLSLSLGSSRCLQCPSHWPLVMVAIIFAALIAGILLVTVLLALNMTVADGMINAIIFYANITISFDRIVFSRATSTFPTVLVAWLNLDIGFDVCFFDGLDAYAKTWLQLAFPAYIISLVVIVIKISEYSPRFTRLIGSRRRDPVATLATLVLLSYTKLLSTTVSVLSFATLTYPDGSKTVVWLVDGNVQYLRGKHIGLVLVAILIILLGVPYTFLLFFWQWLIRIPKIKLTMWTRLTSIITTYHTPYNNKHRYWTGLLLLVRVVLYITVAVTVSDNPKVPLLITIILVGGLLFLKGSIGTRLYRRLSVDLVETIILLNLQIFATFSLYNFKTDSKKQTAIAYVSAGTVFFLLMGEVMCRIILSIGCLRKKTPAEQDRHALLLAPLIQSASLSEVTHSSLEISIPTPSPSEPVRNDFKSEDEKTVMSI